MKPQRILPLLTLLCATPLSAQVVLDEIDAPPAVANEPVQSPDEPLVIVEVMPEFPGGQEAMFKYISNELKYPEEAKETGVQGRVYVTFVVERDGRITEVKVLRGIGSGCDEEAVRVVKGMPNWTPGTQAGKAVRVRYNLPIRFSLD